MKDNAITQPLYIVKTNSFTNLVVGQDGVQCMLGVCRNIFINPNEISIDIYESASDPRKTMLLTPRRVHNEHILDNSFNIYCSELVDPLSTNNECIYIYVKKDLKEDDLRELYWVCRRNSAGSIYGYIHGYANALRLKNVMLKLISNSAEEIDVLLVNHDKTLYNGLLPLSNCAEEFNTLYYKLRNIYGYDIYTNANNHALFIPEKEVNEFKEWLESKPLVDSTHDKWAMHLLNTESDRGATPSFATVMDKGQ